MWIRKIVIAGFVLAAVGLTATVTTVVIGQQPATEGKSGGIEEKTVPASGTTKTAADEFRGTAPPAAGNSRRSGTDEGTAADPAGAGAGGGVEAPPAGSGSAAGTTPGKPKGREKSSAKTPRGSNARSGGGMMSGGPPGGKMGGGPGGMMGGGGMPAGGMMGSGPMSAPFSEDEHLETWVSQALADYAQTEDQAARKHQRELIAKALDQIFDIRQERRMEELETLEQRVQKLRGTLETREKLKADILKNRLDYLIREADGLGWGDGLPAPGRSAPTGMGAPGGGSSSFKRGTSGGYGAGAGSSPASGGPVFGEPFNSGGAGGGAGPGSPPASGARPAGGPSRE